MSGKRLIRRMLSRKREIVATTSLHTTPNIRRMVIAEGPMTFTIYAWKEGQNFTTVRIGPAVAVDKARALEGLGWVVHVTDSTGHQFEPSDFDQLSAFGREATLT